MVGYERFIQYNFLVPVSYIKFDCLSLTNIAPKKLSLSNMESTETFVKWTLIEKARNLPCYFCSMYAVESCQQVQQCHFVGIGESGIVLTTWKPEEALKVLQIIGYILLLLYIMYIPVHVSELNI